MAQEGSNTFGCQIGLPNSESELRFQTSPNGRPQPKTGAKRRPLQNVSPLQPPENACRPLSLHPSLLSEGCGREATAGQAPCGLRRSDHFSGRGARAGVMCRLGHSQAENRERTPLEAHWPHWANLAKTCSVLMQLRRCPVPRLQEATNSRKGHVKLPLPTPARL